MTGERFDTKKESGYAHSVHGTKFDHKVSKVVTGSKYVLDGCDCGLPPWELCRPTCEHAIGG